MDYPSLPLSFLKGGNSLLNYRRGFVFAAMTDAQAESNTGEEGLLCLQLKVTI